MSRIGKQPVVIPEGVEVTQDGQRMTIKGSKGELSYTVHSDVAVTVEDGKLVCAPARTTKQSAAHWGTTRARLQNMVRGVHEGFKKELELQGVGYRAKLAGKNLELSVGYSHPVVVEALEGITFEVQDEVITVSGVDTVLVGQVAANVRAIRKPEPYKGKGVRYRGEVVRRKVGKVVGAAE